jgi:hypothetical protein
MEEANTLEESVFQKKYNEFAEDLLGALPEYGAVIRVAKALSEADRLARFQTEVKVGNTMKDQEDVSQNPGNVLPGVVIADSVWATLSENSQRAIWEHVRVLSICCFMEAGFGGDATPPVWMENAMDDLKKKLGGVDFQNIIKKFMNIFKPGESAADAAAAEEEGGAAGSSPKIPGIESMFENGFPKLPEKFLKGHMARLAQEIVKDITPEDLGLTKEVMAEAEKNPSRAFEVLFGTFSSNPDVIEKTIKRIGNRLQQKIISGAIRPQEIAKEAEELMKEFASNSSFVEMLSGIKGAFGFQDMDIARAAGREGSARLSLARDRLRKKMEQKKQAQSVATQSAATPSTTTQSTASQSAAAGGKKRGKK